MSKEYFVATKADDLLIASLLANIELKAQNFTGMCDINELSAKLIMTIRGVIDRDDDPQERLDEIRGLIARHRVEIQERIDRVSDENRTGQQHVDKVRRLWMEAAEREARR